MLQLRQGKPALSPRPDPVAFQRSAPDGRWVPSSWWGLRSSVRPGCRPGHGSRCRPAWLGEALFLLKVQSVGRGGDAGHVPCRRAALWLSRGSGRSRRCCSAAPRHHHVGSSEKPLVGCGFR